MPTVALPGRVAEKARPPPIATSTSGEPLFRLVESAAAAYDAKIARSPPSEHDERAQRAALLRYEATPRTLPAELSVADVRVAVAAVQADPNSAISRQLVKHLSADCEVRKCELGTTKRFPGETVPHSGPPIRDVQRLSVATTSSPLSPHCYRSVEAEGEEDAADDGQPRPSPAELTPSQKHALDRARRKSFADWKREFSHLIGVGGARNGDSDPRNDPEETEEEKDPENEAPAPWMPFMVSRRRSDSRSSVDAEWRASLLTWLVGIAFMLFIGGVGYYSAFSSVYKSNGGDVKAAALAAAKLAVGALDDSAGDRREVLRRVEGKESLVSTVLPRFTFSHLTTYNVRDFIIVTSSSILSYFLFFFFFVVVVVVVVFSCSNAIHVQGTLCSSATKRFCDNRVC